jgi:hypothetical protein
MSKSIGKPHKLPGFKAANESGWEYEELKKVMRKNAKIQRIMRANRNQVWISNE